ncbi:SPOR domain-containing protein [uncultured Microbulbifer sp.]|uniref:SPOR domain-containing protein n=1 Tax=uncultured Microbulbifer sp. TaxID=348147 RepID=UPI0026089AD9|nr:SPOR domain-containing protein [uncultured Microbulbifer sp.]
MASRDSDSYSSHARSPKNRRSARGLNDGVKQRIVGALVLVALAVIFLPTLFDREGARYIDVTSQIPPAPDIKPIAIAEPQPVEDVEPAPPVAEVFQPDIVEQKGPAPDPEAVSLEQPAEAEKTPKVAEAKPTPESAEPEPQVQLPAEETQLDDKGLPEGWVIQVGAYKESASADRMRSKLLDAGFRAYTRAVDTPKGRLVRVFVGPKLSRVDAQSDKRKLDELLKTETLILRYRA